MPDVEASTTTETPTPAAAPVTDGVSGGGVGAPSPSPETSTPAPAAEPTMTAEQRDERARAIFMESIAPRHEAEAAGETPDVAGRIGTPAAPKPAGTEPAGDPALPDNADAAIAALVSAGMPEAQITAWLKEDANAAVNFGLAQAQKNALASAGASDVAPAPANAAAPPAPASYVEATQKAIDAALKPLLATDGESPGVFLDDQQGAKLLQTISNGLAEQMGQFVAGELAKRDQQLAQVTQVVQQAQEEARVAKIDSELATVRSAMIANHPDLAKDDVWNKVLEQEYDVLVSSNINGKPAYTSVKQAAEKAIQNYFGGSNPANAVARIKAGLFERVKSERRGTPKPAQSRTDDRALTREQIAWQKFNQIADQHEGAVA